MDGESLLEVDGSALEGGGQILRMSVAFSALMCVPIRITKIRLGRKKPGLAAQHLTGLQLVSRMCRARLHGAQLGSTEIEFRPGPIVGGHYKAEVKTAGAISLLMQVSLPFALLADSHVTLDLKGGTNAEMAPQVDYMTEVFRPILEKFGGSFDFELHKRGYFPRGGGEVMVNVEPVRQFDSVTMVESGPVQDMFGWSFVAGTLPIKLAHEMAAGACEELRGAKRGRVRVDCYKEAPQVARDNASGLLLVCCSERGCVLGAGALGSRGVSPDEVGRAAGRELANAVQARVCVDTHAQDQIILYMALARGTSRVLAGPLSLHTRTAIHVAELFTQAKFSVSSAGENNIIECVGIGYCNTSLPDNKLS